MQTQCLDAGFYTSRFSKGDHKPNTLFRGKKKKKQGWVQQKTVWLEFLGLQSTGVFK